MIITHKIIADLIAPRLKAVINAVQSDAYCRKIEITVTAGGVAVEFPDDVSVRGNYRKADGTRGYYDTMPDGTAAGSVAGNVVTLSLAPQLLTAAGVAELAVQLVSGEKLLNVFPIQINVAPLPGFQGVSQDYFGIAGVDVTAIAMTEKIGGSVVLVNSLVGGGTETVTVEADADGNPVSVTRNGITVPITYTVEGSA